MPHDRREADRRAGSLQHAHGVTEVTLGLALIVRLGEALAGENLVGDLGLRSVGERVVDARALGGPLAEPAPGALRTGAQHLTEQGVTLGIDDDAAEAMADRDVGHPCLGHRLARAGGADDERVRAAVGTREGDPHGTVTPVTTDEQPAGAVRRRAPRGDTPPDAQRRLRRACPCRRDGRGRRRWRGRCDASDARGERRRGPEPGARGHANPSGAGGQRNNERDERPRPAQVGGAQGARECATGERAGDDERGVAHDVGDCVREVGQGIRQPREWGDSTRCNMVFSPVLG